MKNWVLWLVVGIVSILGGLFALFNPVQATVAAEQIAGWMFLFVGVMQIFSALRENGFGAKIWALIVGAAGVFVGISLLANPLAGVLSLTVLVAILFLGLGIAKTFMAMPMRGTTFFWPVLISGLLSIVFALMIFGNFPSSAVVILGILLAIELISNGVALVALALMRKGLGEAATR